MERVLSAFNHWPLIIIITAGMFLSVWFKKLTPVAALMGALVSIGVFAGSGYIGIIMMAIFFATGVFVTGWKLQTKQQNGLAETDKGKRKASQVLANAGAPALIGILAYAQVLAEAVAPLMIAACFASATADTVSSELGNVYGSRFYNILTLRKDQRGLNGVISIEGTLLGLLGSIIISLIYGFGYGWTIRSLLIIIIAGTAGNLIDSILGATLERKHYLNNDVVNFLNTCFAALLTYIVYGIYHE
ncbi:MAG: DUF92 domain-containing protein [Agriterribacter sp.]